MNGPDMLKLALAAIILYTGALFWTAVLAVVAVKLWAFLAEWVRDARDYFNRRV